MKQMLVRAVRITQSFRIAFLLLTIIASLAIVGGNFPAAAGDTLRLRTALAGAAIGGVTPSGKAEFRSRPGSSSFTVQVEDVNLTAGTVLRVCVTPSGFSEATAGTITLAGVAPALGGVLDLDGRDGDPIPASIGSGTLVTVKSGASCAAGTIRLTGVL